MRLKVTAPLESRDGTLDKGGLMQNCFAEIDGDVIRATKRPGLDLSCDVASTDYIIGGAPIPDTTEMFLVDSAFQYTTKSTAAASGTYSALPSRSSFETAPYAFHVTFGNQSIASKPYLLKNMNSAWYSTASDLTPSLVTDLDYPGMRQLSVTSITRAGSTVTVTTATPHGFATGSTVSIAGAVEAEYNVVYERITVTGATTFTFQTIATPTTPATGTIICWGGTTTVPGAAFLDGYWFVMDKYGTIYNSDLENPASWNSLNFISCEVANDGGTGIARYQNYIVGFGSYSMEFFYDAANTGGSPLAKVPNAHQEIGCVSGNSIASMPNGIVWLGQERSSSGVGVYSLAGGFVPKKISTPAVDARLGSINNIFDSYGNFINVQGRAFYVLSAGVTGGYADVCLAYDFQSDSWATWTRRTGGAVTFNVSSLTQSGGIATCTISSTGGSRNFTGNLVVIAGADQAGYNVTQYINKVSDTVFTFPVDGSIAATATGTITATLDSPEYQMALRVALNIGPSNIVGVPPLASLTAVGFFNDKYKDVFLFDRGTYQDDGTSIDVVVRTTNFDSGSAGRKVVKSAEIIGDKVPNSTAIVRWTDDDYQTYSKYRYVDLSKERSKIHRLGSTSRRAYEIRHSLNTPFRIEALEIE